jgi:hypothetical protein
LDFNSIEVKNMQATVDDLRLKKMITFDVPNFLSKIERRYNLVELDREEIIGQFLEKFCRYSFDSSRSSLNTFVYMNLRNVVINHVMRRRLDTVSLERVSNPVFRVAPDALDALLAHDFVKSLSDAVLPSDKLPLFGGKKQHLSLRVVAIMLCEGFSVREIQTCFGIKSHKMRAVIGQIRDEYKKNN